MTAETPIPPERITRGPLELDAGCGVNGIEGGAARYTETADRRFRMSLWARLSLTAAAARRYRGRLGGLPAKELPEGVAVRTQKGMTRKVLLIEAAGDGSWVGLAVVDEGEPYRPARARLAAEAEAQTPITAGFSAPPGLTNGGPPR